MKRLDGALVLLAAMLAAAVVAWAAAEMAVQVKVGQLRERPSFLSPVLAEAPYGQALTVLESQGDWRRVTCAAGEGWMHHTAIAVPESALLARAQQQASGASTGELALAGKGFSKSVEDKFREQRGNLDYSWLDRMEAIAVAPQQLQAFVTEGGLSLPGRDG